MTVGVPGVGFGGIFYLIGALFMPVREVVRTARGKSNAERWVMVGTQWSLAAGILVALWATGWVLGHVLTPSLLARTGAGAARLAAPHNVLKVSVLAMSLGMLAILILAVRVTHFMLRRRGGIPVQQLTPMPAAKGPLPDSLLHPDAAEYLETGTDGWMRINAGQYARLHHDSRP
ncbi:MAG TPA: hypothetical protein VH542_05620 [Steroidobacteraceae bacterium]|jgi:hypothetical protein